MFATAFRPASFPVCYISAFSRCPSPGGRKHIAYVLKSIYTAGYFLYLTEAVWVMCLAQGYGVNSSETITLHLPRVSPSRLWEASERLSKNSQKPIHLCSSVWWVTEKRVEGTVPPPPSSRKNAVPGGARVDPAAGRVTRLSKQSHGLLKLKMSELRGLLFQKGAVPRLRGSKCRPTACANICPGTGLTGSVCTAVKIWVIGQSWSRSVVEIRRFWRWYKA